MYIFTVFTNNSLVETFIVWLIFITFTLFIFPIYITNYVYVNTEDKYASLNVCLYRYIRFFNANTIQNDPNHMQINGKDKSIDLHAAKWKYLFFLKRLHLCKVVQLGNYGIQKTSGATLAVTQYVANEMLKLSLKNVNLSTKYKNYMLISENFNGLRYYAKTSIVVNIYSLLAMIFLYYKRKWL